MHGKFYILDQNHDPVAVDLETWATWFEDRANRLVASNYFGHEAIGTIHVSTVCLGIDHRFFGSGPPLIFETMIFAADKELDGYQQRAATWSEALACHQEAIDQVKNAFADLIKMLGA